MRNRYVTSVPIALVLMVSCVLQVRAGELAGRFRADAARLLDRTKTDIGLKPLLEDFCDHNPRRLSGSENLEKGLDWLVARLKSDGWNVLTQPVTVPNWKRNEASLVMTSPMSRPLPVAALGGSIATNGVLKAQVLVVKSYDELKARKSEVAGRIVVYNVEFTNYGATVKYRFGGAAEAARYGAVASLVRSVGPFGLQTLHTGGMGYNDSLQKIPSGAITMEDAMLLQRMQDRGEAVTLELNMTCKWEKEAPSRNIVIELTGTEKPNEVVVMGGHIDSWDLGTGAMDDAAGCFVSWRALTHMRDLGLRPKRTIRVVFWTNEENGTRGGKAYAELTKADTHVLAIESDMGTFAPQGFSTNAKGVTRAQIEDISTLLAPIHATTIEDGEGGADISPLEDKGVPVLGLKVDDTKYFWYHHTEADTPDKLDAREMSDCVYAMAVMSWCFANQ